MSGCGRCLNGWLEVGAEYAEKIAGAILIPLDATPDQLATVTAERDRRRAAALNSVYPCRDCNPKAFYRWATGHYGPEHNAAGCSECNPKAKTRHPAQPPTTRRDLE